MDTFPLMKESAYPAENQDPVACGIQGADRRAGERRSRPASDLVDRNLYTHEPNAMCESFFATLECELPDRRKFQTKVEARMAICEFIEGWYNPARRHSALGYQSPIAYERSQAEQLEAAGP